MKHLITVSFILLFVVTSSYAQESQPRTVSIYKRHMQSTDHDKNNFDHHMHHMLYLSGVADAYTVLNEHRAAEGRALLYCVPDNTSLNGNDYITILEKALYNSEPPLPDDMKVAEAVLVALQKEFPCRQQNK